ncbi:MAG: AMP-binding protein [Hyphomicrobiaceae bacterium]|nr:AMP-binding protein [Hyphomicrobiaceae bacterium]
MTVEAAEKPSEELAAGWRDASPFDLASTRTTLFEALLSAARRHGRKKIVLEDPDRMPLTYGRLVLASLLIGKKLAPMTRVKENVGVLLPGVQGMAVTLFGLTAYGRVPAILNFTAGLKNLRSAVATGQISVLVTSRRFLEAARLDSVVSDLAAGPSESEPALRVIYLEDIRKGITSWDKAKAVAAAAMARRIHRRHRIKPDDAAVVLFTSGTEGAPKGVVLSHANLIANARQIYQHAGGAITPADTLFNPLPLFHSFGLTAGLLMPILNGIKAVLYPSPLHYREIPKLIRATQATFLLATDTFLQGYARAASPGDLDSVRNVVAGAERVKEETRRLWASTGAVILEGYGATECAPVLACNLPGDNRPGCVGRLLPGVRARLEPVPGISDGGQLLVSGPNVMAGYLLDGQPGVLHPLVDGVHNTGDIVSIDEDGFVTIKGRAKRFAKLGGEMVSLAAVETMLSEVWPGANHVVVNLPDPRKGEQLVLVTEKPDADRGELMAHAKAQGFPELWVPRVVLVVSTIPVLGSGKIDYVATAELARQMRPLL